MDVSTAERDVRLAGRQAQALFALLALRPRPRLREAIATDLWPDAGCGSSASLRQALWLVRTGLAAADLDPAEWLEIDQDSIGLRPDRHLDLDVTRFDALLSSGSDGLEEALALYRGDLVEGLGHECFATERERLSDAYEDALATAAELRLGSGDVEGARGAAMTLLARDPLREEAHAVLMRVYGTVGSRAQVHRQYRRLASILRRELEEEPLPETKAIYRFALAQTVERSRRRLPTVLFAGQGARGFVAPS
jgi:DNA-binding SARP family transcriptional activator